MGFLEPEVREKILRDPTYNRSICFNFLCSIGTVLNRGDILSLLPTVSVPTQGTRKDQSEDDVTNFDATLNVPSKDAPDKLFGSGSSDNSPVRPIMTELSPYSADSESDETKKDLKEQILEFTIDYVHMTPNQSMITHISC